jgi:hypothetical protein
MDDCLSQTQRYLPLLNLVMNEYAKMPDERKVVTKKLFRGSPGGGLNGFLCVQNHCNMDPMAFFQPFIHYSLRLVSHFGLSFPETISLISVIEVLPNLAYYFLAAAEAMMTMNASKMPCCHWGFAFGYLIACLVLCLREQNLDSSPGVCFCIYWEPELPTGQECTLKTLCCL